MEKNNIFERIKLLREEKGITQLDLAKELFVKQQTVAQWEKGERDLKTTAIVDIAKYFNVTTDYLLGLSDYKTPQAADIGKITGLSEDNIQKLNQLKNYVNGDTPDKYKNTESKYYWLFVINKLLELSLNTGLIGGLSAIKANISLAEDRFIEFREDVASIDNLVYPVLYNKLVVSYNTIEIDIDEIYKQCNEIINETLKIEDFKNDYKKFMSSLESQLDSVLTGYIYTYDENNKTHNDKQEKEGDT